MSVQKSKFAFSTETPMVVRAGFQPRRVYFQGRDAVVDGGKVAPDVYSNSRGADADHHAHMTAVLSPPPGMAVPNTYLPPPNVPPPPIHTPHSPMVARAGFRQVRRVFYHTSLHQQQANSAPPPPPYTPDYYNTGYCPPEWTNNTAQVVYPSGNMVQIDLPPSSLFSAQDLTRGRRAEEALDRLLEYGYRRINFLCTSLYPGFKLNKTVPPPPGPAPDTPPPPIFVQFPVTQRHNLR